MVLYMLGETEEHELLETEDLFVKRYNHADMLQVFRSELWQFGTVSDIIVDAGAVDMNTWERAAELLQTMKRIPVLLLVNDDSMTETFIQKEHYDILNRAHKDIREMIREWLEHDAEVLGHTWIAVSGLTSGCGVTSLAMHLAEYIRNQGKEVSVTERADIFEQLADAYHWEEVAKNCYQWGGVLYNHNQIDEGAEYTIFDIGTMTDNLTIWNQCQIKILVVDGKPYRRKGLGEQLKRLRGMPGTIILAFTFVPEVEKPELRKKYTSEHVRVWFVPLNPDLFVTTKDYQALVDGYVEPVQEDKKKQNIFPFPIPKRKILAGAIILAVLSLGFGMAVMLDRQRESQYTEVAVEPMSRMSVTGTTRIRLMLAEEQVAMEAELAAESQTEAGMEGTAETEADTNADATTVAAEGEITETIPNTRNEIKHLEDRNAEPTGHGEAGAAEDSSGALSTEASSAENSSTEATQSSGIPVSLTPSLSGYQGQIYTGSQVISIMNKFAGQPVAVHLITRSSDGWYNYSVSGNGLASAPAVSSGTALVDTQCSFLCQVLYVNGEGDGLEFVQQ